MKAAAILYAFALGTWDYLRGRPDLEARLALAMLSREKAEQRAVARDLADALKILARAFLDYGPPRRFFG